MKMKMNKDPWSAATHFVGFLAAIVGLVFLVVPSTHSASKVTAMAIYGGSLVALFGASTLYHFFDLGHSGNRWLRRMDHSAIFALIAGSYMPPIFHLLDGKMRITMISTVGGIAVLGKEGVREVAPPSSRRDGVVQAARVQLCRGTGILCCALAPGSSVAGAVRSKRGN